MFRQKANLLYLLLFLTSAFSGPYSMAQDTVITVTNPIPLAEIAGEITRVNQTISTFQSGLLSENEKNTLRRETDAILFSLNLLREDARVQNISKLNLRSLTNLESDWIVLSSRLKAKQIELAAKVQDLEIDRSNLKSQKQVWEATLASKTSVTASAVLIDQVKSTIVKIDTLESRFLADSDFLQTRLVRLSNAIIFCNDILDETNIAKDRVTRQILDLNKPPIWKMIKSETLSSPLEAQRSFVNDIGMDLKGFTSNNQVRLFLHLILFVISLLALNHLFSDLKESIPDQESREVKIIRSIINRPLSSALLITFLLTYIIYGSLPAIIGVLNLLLLLIPVIIILSDILPSNSKRYIYLPVGATILVQFHSFGYADTAFSRIFLLFIIIVSLLSILIIVRRRTFRSMKSSKLFGRILYFLSLWAIILLSTSLIGVIVGAVTLSEFLTYAVIRSATLILIIYAMSLTVNSIIYTAIYSRYMQKLNLVAQYHQIIYSRISRIINIFLTTLWIVFVFKFFNTWDGLYETIKNIFTNEFAVGEVPLSLGSLILFVFIIWVTIFLSRIIKIVIEGEIAPRVKMKRGVPGALSLMLRIIIISIGFLFAIAAAGFGMDKLTILLGALGVGIGFGLQNIFNNLVSGIILAFERPIQEGDIIEVGALWGTVKEIGIRSSTIFSFEGAEVIVPNGNLISNELINWTLTDRKRRIEVIVGVAYGTDPEKVLEILRTIAENHKEIKQEPVPLALFSGFGESSLDFRLLFWIERADNRFIIQSTINVEVNRAIKEAGIEIPFPQRDLHIRSVDGKAKFRQ